MEKFFKLKENGTNVKTEVIAGITTFMTMAYILAVNPNMLAASGMDPTAVLIATCLASFVGTMCMALMANYPFALAPGMGLNAYFAYTVCIGMGYDWRIALVAVAVGFMTNPVNLLSDGIYYVDEYYMITPRYSDTEESRNSALDYGLDKTYFKISDEWFSKTNNNGTFGKYLLMKYTEKQKTAEIEEILRKLPDELAKKRIRSVCGSDTQLFIVFSNGVRVGADITKDSDGKFTVNSVFRLSDKPHETLPVTDINPDYLEKNAFTNNEDVEIDIIEVNLDKSPYVEVVINNYTGEDLIFEYPDTVYFYQNGNLIDCDMIENREKNTENSYTVNSSYPCQKKISLEGYDLSKTGEYNIVFGFKLSDSGTEYTAGISFEVVGGMPVDENMSSELKGEG